MTVRVEFEIVVDGRSAVTAFDADDDLRPRFV
jgi:hypothetical protein